jgi:hypothetical protein
MNGKGDEGRGREDKYDKGQQEATRETKGGSAASERGGRKGSGEPARP